MRVPTSYKHLHVASTCKCNSQSEIIESFSDFPEYCLLVSVQLSLCLTSCPCVCTVVLVSVQLSLCLYSCEQDGVLTAD